jgi:uncharacterized protein (TIGR03437 family)
MYYTVATKVAALLPSTAAAGDYDVRVIYNGQTSAPRRVKVVERNFGFATQTADGAGPAQATYSGRDLNRFTTGNIADWTTRPAKIGDAVVLWGTGLGADATSDTEGGTSGDQSGAAQVRVIVGGIEVTPGYAGRSGGSPGLDQINFTVPANVDRGCFVSVQVRAGGRLSNLGSLAIAETGQSACSYPSLSETQLAKLDAGGTLTIGLLTLSKTSMRLEVPELGAMELNSESVGGAFAKYNASTIGSASFSALQVGACYVYRAQGTSEEISMGIPATALDAGAQLTLNGPNASNKAVPRVGQTKTYAETLYSSGFGGFGGSGSPTLAQGTYTIAGTGGTDVGAFSAQLAVPGSFTWANQSSLPDPISRGTGLSVSWTGGSTGLVLIFGMGGIRTGGTEENPVLDASVFTCTAPASAGNFTVPTGVLQQLPATTNGMLSVMAVPDASKGQGTFTAPLTAGGNLDQGFFTYSIGGLKTTGWN